MDKVAVLIPCYNEAKTVKKVVEDFKRELPEAVIYVYDNNSKDGTDKIAKDAGAIVRYETRQGKGNVIRTMFREIDAECYIMVDGDDTYPAESAKEMIKAVLEENVDMVIGDRLSSTYFQENKRPFHNIGNVTVRMSVNPEYIINHVEFGTSRLKERVEAINKLVEADYEVGILIAPVIFLENWKELYHELIVYLQQNLSQKAKEKIFFEVIFMTYSYVHDAINKEAFQNSIEIFNKSKMTGRGKGKYMYQTDIRKEGEAFFRQELNQYFEDNKIWYIV